jgi:hypothetical protein
MMEAVSSSEMSANIYQTTRCYIPEDSHLHTRRENLKSHPFVGSKLIKEQTKLNHTYMTADPQFSYQLSKVWQQVLWKCVMEGGPYFPLWGWPLY